jgi:hypothetical protein
VIGFAKTMSSEAFCAAMILRCTAWHQVPAGTLPDDDAALAAMTGLALDAWMSIREQALDGFTPFSEGQEARTNLLLHQEISGSALAAMEEIARKEERRANDCRPAKTMLRAQKAGP